MKVKKSYLKLTVLLAGIVMTGVLALLLTSPSSQANADDYSMLKNGVELQSEILAMHTPDADLKCGGEEGEKKCGEGKDSDKKCGEGDKKCGEDKDGDKKCGEGKCGEGKCGGGEGDAAAKSDKTEDGNKKCGEGKCGEGEDEGKTE